MTHNSRELLVFCFKFNLFLRRIRIGRYSLCTTSSLVHHALKWSNDKDWWFIDILVIYDPLHARLTPSLLQLLFVLPHFAANTSTLLRPHPPLFTGVDRRDLSQALHASWLTPIFYMSRAIHHHNPFHPTTSLHLLVWKLLHYRLHPPLTALCDKLNNSPHDALPARAPVNCHLHVPVIDVSPPPLRLGVQGVVEAATEEA